MFGRPIRLWEVHTALDGPRINQSNREFLSCFTIMLRIVNVYRVSQKRYRRLIDSRTKIFIIYLQADSIEKRKLELCSDMIDNMILMSYPD